MGWASDLRWAIQGPFLWGSPPPHFERWRKESSAFLSTLAEVSHPDTPRLELHRRTPIGRYFERLYGYWLGALPDVRNLHQGIAIQGDKGTLGELDLVFETGNQAFHWELALKYYVGVGDLKSAASWHGPRARDRLDKKLEKLTQKQLRLPREAAARQCLAELGIGACSSHAVMKGYLFYPWRDWLDSRLVYPEGIHPAHDRGYWLPLRDLEHALAMPAARWDILHKPDWLGPATVDGGYSSADVQRWIHKSVEDFGATMIASFDEAGRERQRGFIVPNDWEPLA